MRQFFIILAFAMLLVPQIGFGQSSTDSQKSSDSLTTVTVAANPDLTAGDLKKVFLGKNYRTEWTTPVAVPVLDVKSLKFGKEGGGKQTRSITVEDAAGHSWKLRSVRKFPEGALPDEFKHTIAEKVLYDGISASYPYAGLSIGTLSNAAKVPYYKVSLAYIPDDNALAEHRDKFKNLMVFKEDKEPTHFLAVKKDKDVDLLGTAELVQALANDGAMVDEEAVLQARLLDNFIMDFDRHEEQWKWLPVDKGGRKVYYPIPSDRDQAFFTNQGIIPFIAKSKSIAPELQGLGKETENIRTFNRPARNFDRFILTRLPEEQWSLQIDRFLAAMTDSVIETALRQQPKELHNETVEKIINTLKARRVYFKEEMLKYYRFLSHTVAIVGTNQPDAFYITKTGDDKLWVYGLRNEKSSSNSDTLYSRHFDLKVTKEIQLYGLEGDDSFVVSGPKADIKFRIIGGPGDDKFVNEGTGSKVLAYDVSFEQNELSGPIHDKINNDPLNNTYTRLGYSYPLLSTFAAVEYSSDGGLYLGLRVKSTAQGFRNRPHAFFQYLSLTRAINSNSYHAKYKGEYANLIRNVNLAINGDLQLPTFRTRFYGIGNNTLNPAGSGDDDHSFYLAHYNLGTVVFSLRHAVTPWLTVKAGPLFQYFSINRKRNFDKYINTLVTGQPHLSPRGSQFYAGAEGGVEINTRNDKWFPTRGVVFNAVAQYYGGLNRRANSYTQLGGAFAFYTDFLAKHHLVLASTVGAGHTLGDYQFWQAQYLGFKQNLRGYRIQRFAGRTRAYNNTELRWKIGEANLYLLRGPFGVVGFQDTGRVWADGEQSDTWHTSRGGGIWIAPFNKALIALSLCRSKEEKGLLLLNVGFQF